MSIPVTLTVVQPPRGAQALLARYRLPIIFGAVGLAGVVLIAILLSGRLHLGFLRTRREQRKRFEDPVTQPVPALLENSGLMPRKTQPKDQSKTGPRRMLFTRAEPSRVPDAPAYLIRLTAGGEPASGMPIPVLETEIVYYADKTVNHDKVVSLEERRAYLIRQYGNGDETLIRRWPIFNLADCWVVIGIAFLVLSMRHGTLTPSASIGQQQGN